MILQSSCVGSLSSRDQQMDLRELLKERLLRKENTVVEPWASLTGNPFALLLTLSCKLFSWALCIESNLHPPLTLTRYLSWLLEAKIMPSRLYPVMHIIKQIVRTAFLHLHSTSKIRIILSQSDVKKTFHAFMTSRPDYCNTLFFRLYWSKILQWDFWHGLKRPYF